MIRISSLFAAMAVVATAASGRGDDPVLWEIGNADNSTKEFALAPNGYEKFANDALFVVGRSDPKRDWPYCHPGPNDLWAASRSHTFTVVFNVSAIPGPPAGEVRVRLLLCDSHSQSPPRVEIALNGTAKSFQTIRGAGDASITQGKPGRPSELTVEFPLSLLATGPNTVDIRNVAASWFLYDAVQFLAPEGVQMGKAPSYYRVERVEDTILQRTVDGRPTQVVRVEVLGVSDAPAQARLTASIEAFGARETIRQTATVKPGKQWLEVDIPRLTGWPAKVAVELAAPGGPTSAGEATVHPHRAWTVYLVAHSHVDIGYTEVQPKVLALQKDNIVKTMDFVEAHPDLDADAQFCWNVEVLWAVKDFLREADDAQRTRFFRHVRKGTIGLDALYGNELTGLCSPEEMIRLIDYAGRLVRENGVVIDSAMITDVPGYSWGLIAALGGAGVRYFDFGPNANARIGSSRRAWRDRPFYWESPDGQSRVLAWSAPMGYYRMFNLLRDEKAIAGMLRYLRSLEAKPHFPFDVARLRMCTGDNGTPPFELSEFVRDWNARYDAPRLVIGRTRDAFVRLEQEFGDQLPVHAGEFVPYWEDGAASSADETTRNRRAAKSLAAAEKIWAAANAVSPGAETEPPSETIDRAWDNVLLYDEHTWGAHNSITQPDEKFVADQWKIKQAFALDAEREADWLVHRALETLAGQVPTAEDTAVLVFNPCSWERTDVARFQRFSTDLIAILDAHGRPVATVRSEDGKTVSFIARDVPPLGYRTYRIVPPEGAGQPSLRAAVVDPEKGVLKSRFFELKVDKDTGSVAHVTAPGRGLAPRRAVSRGGFNRYIYCRDGDPEKISFPESVEIAQARPDAPDGAALIVRSKAPGCRVLVQKIEVHGELPWIDIANTLDRDDVRVPEGIYFDFPFDGLRRARMSYDTAWTPVRLEDDLLPGSCKNWICPQHYVAASDGKQTVVLAHIDAALAEIGEIHPNTRRHNLAEVEHLRLQPPRVLSFVMNNYWFTNYRASQPGTTTFRYRLYRFNGHDPVKIARSGIEAREPLRAFLVPAGQKGSLPAKEHSFARVRPDNVIVSAVQSAETGGTLIRLHEIAGRRANVRLTLGEFGDHAERVDLWERSIQGIEVDGGKIRLTMRPREIVTIRVF